MQHKRGQWATNIGFILAAAGSAIGLGNIWKFPGKVGAYGGGAFILCYILIVALIGYPVMLAELSIGRKTQKNVVGTFRQLNPKWTFAGGIGVLTLFVIMSYYSVVGGWVLKYMWIYLTGGNFGTGENPYQNYFVNFISEPVEPLLWGAVFLAVCIYVVARGVSAGIEKVSKVLMPGLFVLLAAIVIRVLTLPDAWEGVKFMLTIPEGTLSGNTLVGALGQAFFSLSVGMGIMLTYGSYVPKEKNLRKSAAIICTLDTLVAILAAFAIVPVVYITLGKDGLGMGGGFAFMALPEVFGGIPGGAILGFLFFTLLFLAALTSAISILESCVAFLTEEFGLSCLKAAIFLSIPMTLLSVGYSLSQSEARGINLPWFDFANGVQMLPMNAVMEKFTDNLMIPLGALCYCLFVGWSWGTKAAGDEITSDGKYSFKMFRSWSFIIRFLAPVVILGILYFTLGKGQGLS
ncbi:MAG: sodium-dependent transporter [Candidatus Merdivicinus sp.]|jgi:NSS family neurotransmitter:Na+ symporter